jgi:CheY-like chemotaxis protein
MKRKLESILLIDDDDASNFINKYEIKKANITDNIVVVLNGREALEYLTNTGKYEGNGPEFPKPTLVFLDINMPVMDGWEFLNAYEKLEEGQKAKIIIVMLTTSFNPDDKKRADKIPSISGYKNKPLTKEIISEIVQTYFSEYL